MTMRIFGTRYPAPAYEGALLLETPVGRCCVMCGERIRRGDSGVFMPAMQANGTVAIEPEHIECHTRSITGSVAHLEGSCTCFDGPGQHDAGQSYRTEARAVMAWLDHHQPLVN